MELRAYAEAWRQAQRKDVKLDDRPTGGLYDLAREIEMELVMEARGLGKKSG